MQHWTGEQKPEHLHPSEQRLLLSLVHRGSRSSSVPQWHSIFALMAARPHAYIHLIWGTCAPPKGHCNELGGLLLPSGNMKTWGGLVKRMKLILQGEMSIKQRKKAVPTTSSEIHILISFWHCKDGEFGSGLSGTPAGGDLCCCVMERDLQRRSHRLSPFLSPAR